MIRAAVLLVAVGLAAATFTLTPVDTFRNRPALSQDIIEAVNSNPDSTWTAGVNERFAGMTIGQVQDMLMSGDYAEARDTKLAQTKHITRDYPNFVPRPEGFDGRVEFADCIAPIRDQGHCGSCWAFGSVVALNDRYCAAGSPIDPLSTQDVVSCDSNNMGCSGGWGGDLGWYYLQSDGAVSEECYPYISGTTEKSEPCKNECQNANAEWKKNKAGKIIKLSGASAMAAEIENGGSIEVAFTVYEDFLTYKEGVYQHTTGGMLGGHAVRAVGYGTDDDGVDYWIVANSWGEKWGADGYVNFIRGKNDCTIESNSPMTGEPDL